MRWMILFVIGCVVTSVDTASAYTYADLCARLTDLHLLATPAPVGETTSLASSYDRASQYYPKTDHYIHWDANGDGNGVVRMEGKQSVFADIQGPGCIVRIWSARTKSGHVKIYLDGNEIPAIDLPFSSYFDQSVKPFDRTNLVYKTTAGTKEGGLNNFTPIPFQKSCKIVADPDWGMFYQITYTQFPAGTVVPTFSMNLPADDAAALDRANQLLGQRGPTTAPSDKQDDFKIQAAPGKTTTVANLTGPDAIDGLRVKLDLPKDAAAAQLLLKQLAIQITWDDEKTPAVWAPLADFFGYFGGSGPYQSLPLGLTDDGVFFSNWYMPFATGAKIEVINDGPAAVPMDWHVAHVPQAMQSTAPPAAQLNRFHAKWHRDAFVTSRPDRLPDWTMLTTTGTGRYVGTQLHVWNPRGGWWGEGDDKFFVDGEKFPSSFGTGSEDYFGAAWGLFPFDKAFHGFLASDPAHAIAHRWHIVDSVPFQKSMEADIEKYWGNERPTLFECTVYWYLNPDGNDPYPPLSLADRLVDYTPPPIYHEPGVIEAESFTVITQHPDSARDANGVSSSVPANIISGDHYLSWRTTKPDDLLEVKLTVATEGDYDMVARLISRHMAGIFQLKLDGKNFGQPVDEYADLPPRPSLKLMDPTDFGLHHLTAGDHILSVQLLSINPAAAAPPGASVFFGMDWIKLIPKTK